MAEKLSWPSPDTLPVVNVQLKRRFDIIDAGLVLTVVVSGPSPVTSDGPVAMPTQQTLVLCDTTAGGFTLTLPIAASVIGSRVVVQVVAGVGLVTLAAAGAELIGGASSVVFNTETELVSIGTGWREL
jgi:hypothetical protein